MNDERFRERLEKRRAERGPTKDEILLAEGKRFYSFVFPIALFSAWVEFGDNAKTPNDRLLDLIKKDMKREK